MNLNNYSPKLGKWIFVCSIILVFFIYNYHKILLSGPYSIHQWRQADCLSITTNYYQEGMKFFEPSVHWCGAEGNGKTVSEFPLIYYFVAFLWKLFGKYEFIFRLVNLSIVFTGLFCLYKISEELLKDTFWAVFVPLFLFTSPILVYYANNFMADVPAFSLGIIGWYFFLKFYKHEKNIDLYFFMLFFCWQD